MRPDQRLFDYYVSLLGVEKGRFDTGFMEMGLLNYAHRRVGNMPWQPLTPGLWSSNWPGLSDVKHGTATLHDKFWDAGNKGWIDRELVEMWWRVQGMMEGFWLAVRDGEVNEKIDEEVKETDKVMDER